MVNPALTRELSRWWADINRSQFGGAMRPPSLLVDESSRRLGCWDGATRTIQLSGSLIAQRPWSDVIEVLRHEMAHQYVDEVLGVQDETAHGPAFRRVCEQRAILSCAAADLNPSAPAAAVMRKIRALLSLAESDNENEAKSAMTMAHRLMRKHNIRAAGANESGEFAYRQLGTPRRRTPAHEKILAGLLGRHFFVQPVWVHAYMPTVDARGRVLEVCGRPENLAIAEYVHGFMLETCERLWLFHKSRHGITGNRDRRRYLQGVMLGFQDSLDTEAVRSEETGLVWVGDARLVQWLGRRHPHLRSSRPTTVRVTGAFEAGHAAGQRVVLRRAVAQQSPGMRGLLPST
ncbi:MAG: DUF2786 domain-containing protein [Myxococcota bacterium]|nr:DUF2786 domain-containing protein [Myxococcota bacterium]